MQLYGVRGWGSGITEAMLEFAGLDFEFIDVADFTTPGPSQDRLRAVNPLLQVPVLILDDGTTMTETAAISLYLVDHGIALAPPIGTADRALFYRLLIWLVANVYPTFTYGDHPERWVQSAPAELVASTDRHRETLFRWLEGQVREPFVLGDAVSALDIYLAAMVSWRPGWRWFEINTPKLAAIVARTQRLPSLAHAMGVNGWAEG